MLALSAAMTVADHAKEKDLTALPVKQPRAYAGPRPPTNIVGLGFSLIHGRVNAARAPTTEIAGGDSESRL
jgi:hypothetical protein